MCHLFYLLKLGQAELCTELLPWHPTPRETLELRGRELHSSGARPASLTQPRLPSPGLGGHLRDFCGLWGNRLLI